MLLVRTTASVMGPSPSEPRFGYHEYVPNEQARDYIVLLLAPRIPLRLA